MRAANARLVPWRLWVLGACALFFSTAALAQTCALSGGKWFCGSHIPTPWSMDACDEQSASGNRRIAWCSARGGTWNGSDCLNPTPFTEGNVVGFSIQWANNFRASSCSVTNDTGWGATYTSNFCLPGGDQYQYGFHTWTSRRLSIVCADASAHTISIKNNRGVACPVGYQSIQTASGWTCARPIDCNDCDRIGNPITLSGVKLETAVDYAHPSGLELVRNYHSMRFYEPMTTANNTHTENRLGIVWRTGFDKRIVPIVPTHATLKHAISLPNGDFQYFDASGVEQYNYGRGRGTLVTVAGVGYYYRHPEKTEFYGPDGRLRTITRHDGKVLTLTYSDGNTGPNGGFIVDWSGNPTAHALPANRLIRVTDSYGKTLSFGLDGAGRIITATDPEGGVFLYGYDHLENLTSVTFPDGKVRRYRYNEPANMVGGANLPHALTSIEDENGNLHASFKYNTGGLAVSTERAGGTNKYEMTYSTTSTAVTDPHGVARTISMANVTAEGVTRLTANNTAGGAGFGTGIKARAYDAAGNVLSSTDFNDIKTCYAYAAGRNLESVRVEGVPNATACSGLIIAGAALPSGARKVTTGWHARWRLPVKIAEPLRTTTIAYNGDPGATCAPGGATIDDGGGSPLPIAVACSRSVQATTDTNGSQGFSATPSGTARVTAYTYNATGQVLTADGPRTDVSDVTTYTYDADGNVATVTNAATHLTSYTAYNDHGQPRTVVDANGLTTTLSYDARRRLVSRTAGGETTSYDYDNAGQLIKVTLPDGSWLAYTYDAAHRLTEIADNLGNRIVYTLDLMGNRTAEQVRDPSNVLAQTRSRVYSNLNRLFREVGATSQTTEYTYDNNGNVLTVKDPLLRITTNQYDALNRLKQVTDPGTGVTQYGYDGIDQLVSVTDPRSLVTTYAVNGLGNLVTQVSPDTGSTANTYDAAGNLLTQTDAKNQVTTYAYDALNRVTQITFHDASKQVYAYDGGANGIGRLTSITERDPANAVVTVTSYGYDLNGRVTAVNTAHGGVTYTVGYGYDSAGRVSTMTYPSGRSLAYTYDVLGRVNSIATTKAGQSQVLAAEVAYFPFGGVKGYTLGNGQAYSRSFDLDARISTYSLGSQSFGIGYDAASRIEQITDLGAPANFNSYGYDALDRLTSATIPGTPFSYSYDAVGNRLSRTAGAGTENYTYSPTANRIATVGARSFTFDANGSTTSDGNNTYAYDVRGRMQQATSSLGATAYKVNALGQRMRKTNSLGDTVYHYDSGGRLIAETDAAGVVKREYAYLGDLPLAVLQ